jgi:hypothetical protein
LKILNFWRKNAAARIAIPFLVHESSGGHPERRTFADKSSKAAKRWFTDFCLVFSKPPLKSPLLLLLREVRCVLCRKKSGKFLKSNKIPRIRFNKQENQKIK